MQFPSVKFPIFPSGGPNLPLLGRLKEALSSIQTTQPRVPAPKSPGHPPAPWGRAHLQAESPQADSCGLSLLLGAAQEGPDGWRALWRGDPGWWDELSRKVQVKGRDQTHWDWDRAGEGSMR